MWNSNNMCEGCDKGNRSSVCVQNNDKNEEERDSREKIVIMKGRIRVEEKKS